MVLMSIRALSGIIFQRATPAQETVFCRVQDNGYGRIWVWNRICGTRSVLETCRKERELRIAGKRRSGKADAKHDETAVDNARGGRRRNVLSPLRQALKCVGENKEMDTCSKSRRGVWRSETKTSGREVT